MGSTIPKPYFIGKLNKKAHGNDSLTWVKQPVHICRCYATRFQYCTETRTQLGTRCKKVKGYPRIIIWTNLVDLEYQDSASRLSWFWRRRIGNCFITISGHGGHLVQWCATVWKNCNTPMTEGHKWNLVQIGPSVYEKKTFNDFIYVYSPEARADKPPSPGDKTLIVTKRFYRFYHTL